MKHDDHTPKHKKIHTLINVGLICFLILAATIGMRGLTSSSLGREAGNNDTGFTGDNIMVCAIGHCLFV